MNKFLLFILIAVIFSSSGCVTGRRNLQEDFSTEARIRNNGAQEDISEAGPEEVRALKKRKDYTISPKDVLYINVWENPDLTQEVIVRPDGKISFPLIDEVYAQGLTITELDTLMTEELKSVVRYPDVSISLKKMAPVEREKVVVLGEVRYPGVYPIADRRTVLEAIALAGGSTKDAVLKSVVVVRGGGLGTPQAQRVNLARALATRGEIRENISLKAQDIVYVPRRFVANLNYFATQILDPIVKGVYIADYLLQWEYSRKEFALTEESHEWAGESHELAGESHEWADESHEWAGESHEWAGEEHQWAQEEHAEE